MRRPKNHKKFSVRLRSVWVIAKRDRVLIIVALLLGLALHIYVKYEKANIVPETHQELHLSD
jgi:hypothetical protein